MGNKIKMVLAAVMSVIFILIGVYSAGMLYKSYSEYAAGDRTYEMIAGRVVTEGDESEDNNILSRAATIFKTFNYLIDSGGNSQGASLERSVNVEVPELTIDYDELNSISPNAIGWLYCPDTVIDYPVMKSEDYKYYLTHLPDDTYNKNGSLFLDYSCETDFTGRLSVIYGHCMKTGSMFGTLSRYKKQSYYDEHPYLYLYTKEQNYRIALIYGAVVAADTWTDNDYAHNVDELLEYAKTNSTFKGEVQYSTADSFIVLSTCSYEFTDARYFVIGVLQKEQ